MKIKPRKEIYEDLSYNYYELGNGKICFMFSGTGYTYDKPLLYYSTALLLELGYDVVQVCYSFEQQQFEQEPETISQMVYNATNPIVTNILNTMPYQEVVYIGKSLGTLPIIDFYMQHATALTSRYVLYTPLLSLDHIIKNLAEKHTFLAIGTADPHFSREKIALLKSHQLTIIDKADHSLEVPDNIGESITICQSLLTELKAFLQN